MSSLQANPILKEDLEYIHSRVGAGDRFKDGVVVITGCAGFLGYYFLQYLTRYAAELKIKKLIGLDTFLLGRPAWIDGLASQYRDILELKTFDISKDSIASIDGAADASFVIHMASIASPTFYRKYPVETMDGNIWGLRHLLDHYRGSSFLRGLLFFSSSEIYGDPDPQFIPTPEDYRGLVACVGPRACYDESKRFGETMCYVFSKTYGMPITVARPFNNYGPGMRADDRRLPADMAKCVLENRDIVILSDGKPTRTFCYIADAIAGYLKCLLHGKFDYFNIGIEKPEISVLEFANIFQSAGADVFGYRGKVLIQTTTEKEYLADNPNRRCPVIRKAREVLGYNPSILVQEGIARYLKFLKYESA